MIDISIASRQTRKQISLILAIAAGILCSSITLASVEDDELKRIIDIGALVENADGLLAYLKMKVGTSHDDKTINSKVAELVSASKQALYNFADRSPVRRNRRVATVTYVKAMHSRGDLDYLSVGTNLVNKNLSSCAFFEDCLQLIQEVANLVDIFPQRLLDPNYTQTIQNSISSIKFAVFRDILRYQFESLLEATKFNAFTGSYSLENVGKAPRLSDEQIQELKSRLLKLTSAESFYTKANLDEDKIKAVLIFQREGSDVPLEQLTRGRLLTAKAVFNKLDQATKDKYSRFAQQLLGSWQRTYFGNQSLLLYLPRTRERSARNWLRMISATAKLGVDKQQSISPVAAFIALNRFAKQELALPERRLWLETAESFTSQLAGDKYKFLNVVESMDAIKSILTAYEVQLLDFLDRHKFTAFNSDGAAGSTLQVQKREEWLARNFSGFHSLIYQHIVVDQGVLSLSHNIDRLNAARRQREREQIANIVNDQTSEAFFAYSRLRCYSYWLPSEAAIDSGISAEYLDDADVSLRDENVLKFRFPIGEDEISTPEVCGRDPRLISSSILNYFQRRRINDFRMEAALKLANIPLVLIAAHPAGKANQFANQMVANIVERQLARFTNEKARKIAGKLLLDGFAKRAALFTARGAMPHLAGSAVGAFTFTLVQKSALAAAGVQKIYDPKLSLWKNYGAELTMGTAIFFVAPIAHYGASSFVANRVGISSAAELERRLISRQLTLKQEAFTTFGMLGTDTLVFTAAPTVDRLIKNLLGENEDVWQGSDQFLDDLWSSVEISTVFRGMALYSHHRMRQGLVVDAVARSDYYKILGVTPDASYDTINKAYRKLSFELHPDRGGDATKFREVAEAFDVLKDESLRSRYDSLSSDHGGASTRSWMDDLSGLLSTIWKKHPQSSTECEPGPKGLLPHISP